MLGDNNDIMIIITEFFCRTQINWLTAKSNKGEISFKKPLYSMKIYN